MRCHPDCVLYFQGKWVLPALKQLLQITKNITKHSFHKAEKVIRLPTYSIQGLGVDTVIRSQPTLIIYLIFTL